MTEEERDNEVRIKLTDLFTEVEDGIGIIDENIFTYLISFFSAEILDAFIDFVKERKGEIVPQNFFQDLNPIEEQEYRQWARENFNPKTDSINPVWHPIVRDECNKIVEEELDKPEYNQPY